MKLLRSRLGLLLGLVLLAARAAHCQERPAALPKVVLLGDSIRLSYTPYVQKALADKAVVVAGANSRWARRRKITLADLRDASWVGTPRETLTRTLLERGYQTANMPPPAMQVMTFSVQLRVHLLTTGDFLTTMPKSMLKLNPECRGLQELPITLPSPSFPVVLVTLKGRTLTPPAELFLDGLREHVRELGL